MTTDDRLGAQLPASEKGMGKRAGTKEKSNRKRGLRPT